MKTLPSVGIILIRARAIVDLEEPVRPTIASFRQGEGRRHQRSSRASLKHTKTDLLPRAERKRDVHKDTRATNLVAGRKMLHLERAAGRPSRGWLALGTGQFFLWSVR